MRGEGTEDGGRSAGGAAVTRSSLGAEAWLLHFNVAHQSSEGISPDLETRRGVLQRPRTNGGGLRKSGAMPTTCLGSVPHPKMAPGRCLPRDGGQQGAGPRRGQRSGAHRAARFSEWPARAPRTLQFGEQAQPGTVLSRPAAGSWEPGAAASASPRPCARAGLRGCGCNCEQGGRRKGAGAHKGRGGGAGGGGLAGPEPRP